MFINVNDKISHRKKKRNNQHEKQTNISFLFRFGELIPLVCLLYSLFF
jgi:hypothetical protein